jgi:signal transduction histidine kinase
MRERAEMMGGALVVESSPGRGTTVQIDIPFLAAKSDLPENFPSGGV